MPSTKRRARSLRARIGFTSGAALLTLQLLTLGQSPTQTDPVQGTPRKILSEDFTKNRQQVPSSPQGGQIPSNNRPKPNQQKRTYRLASQTKSETPAKTTAVHVSQLGITIWRLRPVAVNEKPSGARMLVRENNQSSQWIPERVEADTTFREGDQIRLSIEAPRTGYLYVIDRDWFADDSTGTPMLIYPWVDRDGSYDNQMRPGRLVDIPAQEDQPAYFTARRSRPNQVGEVLTIIISSAPLNIQISDKPLPISKVTLSQWEKTWGGISARFEMEGGAGETWTHAEQQASAHSGSRQLTREDPAPQTIYRVSGADEKALLVSVRLNYGN